MRTKLLTPLIEIVNKSEIPKDLLRKYGTRTATLMNLKETEVIKIKIDTNNKREIKLERQRWYNSTIPKYIPFKITCAIRDKYLYITRCSTESK